jgi:ribose 5-phosphate isomerase A
VDARAERLVIVVDATKLVDHLGQKMPLPVEVLPAAYRQVARRLEQLGGAPELRMAVRKAGPVVTDQGNLILDARFERIDDPAALESAINNIPGVLDNGLFVGLADSVLVGEIADGAASVREL